MRSPNRVQSIRNSRSAFTIIEMLIVSAIIATPLAILFPAIRGVKDSAGISTCATNLKQLGAACEAFLATYNG